MQKIIQMDASLHSWGTSDTVSNDIPPLDKNQESHTIMTMIQLVQ